MNKKLTLIGAATVAVITSATFLQASPNRAVIDRHIHAANPGAPERRATVKAVDTSVNVFKKNLVTHAASEESWYKYPQFTAEYGFSYNDDTRTGGIDADIHGGSIGLNWLTVENVSLGGMVNATVSDGDAVGGLDSDTVTVLGTVFAAHNFLDWGLVGTSITLGGSNTDNRTRGTNFEVDGDSYTFSIYAGGFYAEDDWSFYSTPTYAVTMQHFGYTNGQSDQSSSTGSIIWTNSASYNVNEDLTLSLNMTPNFIVHDEVTTGNVRGDDMWVNVGLSGVNYFDENVSMNWGYSYDAFNCDFNNHNFNLGVAYDF